MKEMVQLYSAGDHAGARRIDQELEAPTTCSRSSQPDRIKAALNLLGYEVGGPRLPLVEATEDETAQVRACLERLGLLSAVPASTINA